MSYFEATTSVSTPSVGARVGALASRLWGAYSQGRARRVARRELQSLDDRMLKDIGISRGEIEFVVCGHQPDRQDKACFDGLHASQRYKNRA
jgi:uncharacterized protein YjiS (DUF1127 family)